MQWTVYYIHILIYLRVFVCVCTVPVDILCELSDEMRQLEHVEYKDDSNWIKYCTKVQR